MHTGMLARGIGFQYKYFASCIEPREGGMKPRGIAATVATLLFTFFLPANSQTKTSGTVLIEYLERPGGLLIDAPGFEVKTYEKQYKGLALRRYFFAENAETHVVVSILLEDSPKAATQEECRGSIKQRGISKEPFQKTNVSYGEVNGVPTVEYLVPETEGKPVKQQNLWACFAKGNYYADLHLSKVLFEPADEKMFMAILKSVHFIEDTPANMISDAAAGTRPQPAAITGPALKGTFSDARGPITDAAFRLLSFKDERCARKYGAADLSLEEMAMLMACVRRSGFFRPDAQGRYELGSLPPGWYAVSFHWNTSNKPSKSHKQSSRDNWEVTYSAKKEVDPHYDSVAVTKPFFFSGKEDAVFDFRDTP